MEDKQEDKPTTPKIRKKRQSNPLTKKDKKPEIIKNLDDIHKPSLGTELIESLRNQVILKVEDTINNPIIIDQTSPDEPETIIEDTKLNEYVGEIINGVEVVDVKAIERDKKPSVQLDKFGIPIQRGEYRNFDKI